MSITYEGIRRPSRLQGSTSRSTPSKAQQGPTLQEYSALLIAQRLSGGSQAALDPVTVTSADEVLDLAGQGSQAAQMAERWFPEQQGNQAHALPPRRPGGGCCLDRIDPGHWNDGVAGPGRCTCTSAAGGSRSESRRATHRQRSPRRSRPRWTRTWTSRSPPAGRPTPSRSPPGTRASGRTTSTSGTRTTTASRWSRASG